eukprot:865392_1
MISIQMGSHEMHRVVPHDVDFEREIVASWLRNTVQLPQGFENMEYIQCIADQDDLRKLGIKMAGHRTKILGEIKLLRDTQFVTPRVDGNNDSGSYLDGNEITQ